MEEYAHCGDAAPRTYATPDVDAVPDSSRTLAVGRVEGAANRVAGALAFVVVVMV
jgi:hypothetical protein